MPRILICFVLIFLVSSCDALNNSPVPKESRVGSGYQPFPFPDGYDYPLDADVLENYVKEGKLQDMRRHAWNLFEGVNQDAGGRKIWETWYTQVEAFAPTETGSELASSRVVPELSERRAGSLSRSGPTGSKPMLSPDYNCKFEGERFLNNGDILIAGVLYDAFAYGHIRDNAYYLASTLEALRDQGKTPGGRIEEFPRESLSVKHMYWPVRGDGKTALPVWDFPKRDPDVYNGYETWTRVVAIDPDPTRDVIPKGETAVVSYLYLDDPHFPERTFDDARVVSIKRFFHYKIGEDELRAMDPVDRCILNQSARWNYGREFQEDDYIVSVAMHIVTKEFAPWTMQTFWWHDDPQLTPWGNDRPDGPSDATWRNYLLCTAYTMEEVCYNPYIELVVPEPGRIVSNCQNCHFRGAWPASDPPWKHAPGVAYYDAGQRGHSSLEDAIFEGLVWTDFSWAIPLASRGQD